MNKKALSLLAVLALGSFAGCGTKESSSETPAAKKYSVGLGYSYKYEYTEDDATTTDVNEELGQVDMTVAFAAFDEAGKVYDVRFDVVQVKFTANEARTGIVLTNKNVDDTYSVTSKLELGAAYGMLGNPYGSTLAEVDTQIEAFADWCVGKTADEVVAGTPGAGHVEAVNDELANSVTITVDEFENALKDAYARKSTATYELSGTAGVAMQSGLAYNYGDPSTDVSVDVAGVIAKDGAVEVALIDAIVVPMDFETAIAVKNDNYYVKDGALRSKKVLGDEYGMKGYENHETGAVCTLEWYEQAAIVENAAKGKTKDQISAFVANEGELAGATITLTNYFRALAKATDYAGRTVIAAR